LIAWLLLHQDEAGPDADPSLSSKTPTEVAFEQHFLQNQASWAAARQSLAEKQVLMACPV
jgi:hypothetical protein